MSRYRGPRLRITRRLGELPGLTRKSSAKQNPPGQHGSLPKKPSQYSIRLQEKQKLRFHYGVSEHQLIGLVKKARRQVGSTGERVLQLLEMRLDTIIFRSGFAPTLRASRQLVNHGHIQVNSRSVNIPSYQMKPGDTFEMKLAKPAHAHLHSEIDQLAESRSPKSATLTHIQSNTKECTGVVKTVISRDDVSCPVNEFLIIEYYSRKI